MFRLLDFGDAVANLQVDALGFSHLRLLPKSKGMRFITNMKRKQSVPKLPFDPAKGDPRSERCLQATLSQRYCLMELSPCSSSQAASSSEGHQHQCRAAINAAGLVV